MNILSKNSQIFLLFRVFAVFVIIAFVHIYNLNAQDSNNAEANINAQPHLIVEDQRANEIKYNEQIVELKRQIAELNLKVGDNKQVFYDSLYNAWNLILAIIGIIFIFIAFSGKRNLSEKITELKNDLKNATDNNGNAISEIKTDLNRCVSEIKTDLNQRISESNEKIRDFKDDLRENFTRFEKESKEKIDNGLSYDLQKAIKKIMDESFTSQLNENSEQISELRNKVENFLSQQVKTEAITQEPITTKPEVNQFDGKSEQQPTGEKNAFDE